MKLFVHIALLSVLCVLNSACVSRTVTSEKSFGEETSETHLVWIWQDEFRNPK